MCEARGGDHRGHGRGHPRGPGAEQRVRGGPAQVLPRRESGRGPRVRLPGRRQQGEELLAGDGVPGRPRQEDRDVRACSQGNKQTHLY